MSSGIPGNFKARKSIPTFGVRITIVFSRKNADSEPKTRLKFSSITDALLIIVGGPTWSKLSDGDKKIFEEVLKEAVDRCTKEIVDIEAKLAAEFEKRGKTVLRVDRKPFRDAVMKMHNGPDATWPKDVYDRLQALK